MHLIHPALVHFSVAFIVVGGLCEAIGILLRRETLALWGGQLTVIGLISLAPTIASGYLAANTVSLPDGGKMLLDWHERNGLVLAFMLLLTLFWKAWNRGELAGFQAKAYALTMLVVVWIAVFEGYDCVPTSDGLGKATTRTVVHSSLAVLGLDFVLTALMFSE